MEVLKFQCCEAMAIFMQDSLPETLGIYQYLTRATPARPLPCYLRRQSSGFEEILLDMNDISSEGSLGQVLDPCRALDWTGIRQRHGNGGRMWQGRPAVR